MNKLGAIAHYELLMAWRRRSLPILWLLLFVGVLGFGLLINDVNRRNPVMNEAVQRITVQLPSGSQTVDAREIDLNFYENTVALVNLMVAAVVVYTIGVTMMLGETIPLDRQFKVRELLDALPVSRAAYFGGKLLGVWAGLLIGLVVVGASCALALRLIFGVYDLRVFVALWMLMLVPVPLLASAISVLLASPFASRRAAVLIGLVLVPVVLILIVVAVYDFALVAALIDPIYALGMMVLPGQVSNAEIAASIVTMLLKLGGLLLGVWTLVWAWARWREAR